MIAAVLVLALDLSSVRTIYVAPEHPHESWKHAGRKAALAEQVPELPQVRRDDADLLIEYTEHYVVDGREQAVYLTPGEETHLQLEWKARLSRLDCQSPNFGEPPTPAIDGYCENRVYIEVTVGELNGLADDSESAKHAFILALRKAAGLSW